MLPRAPFSLASLGLLLCDNSVRLTLRDLFMPNGQVRLRPVHAPIARILNLIEVSGLFVCALAVGAQCQLSSPPKALPALTHVDQIRQLSPEEASLGYPVLVRGVITMDAPAPDFFVQDSTAGIYVEGSVAPKFPHQLGEFV